MNDPQGNRALCFREAMAHVCSPRLPDAPIWIVCTVDAVVDGGDHKIVTGSVDDAWHCEANPLTYRRRVFGAHSSS
ncbi:flavin reductase [Rhodococcus sp. 5A-K4]|uniref:flavin reductase n=1 Tax=Rhodococcus sp. 5A-K4 TaxID=3384442 RepID=UPI0038D50D9F